MPATIYDRYARTKGWKRILFPAGPEFYGRALQAAELNEMQRVMGDEFAQFARTIFSDGSIVRGMELVIQGGLAKITTGQIYYAGFFHDFAGGQVAITGVGDETVGLTIAEVTTTEVEDTDLRDPAQNWPNYGLPGAYRLTYTLAIVKNNSAAVPLYVLRDGIVVSTARPEPDFTELAKTLARRTNDESGSYLVSGLLSRAEAYDASKFNLVTNTGKAYVQGFEITLPAPRRNLIDRPLDTRTVPTEPKVYTTGTNLYPLNNTPVSAITAVSALVEKAVVITRGNAPGGQDLMPYTPISSIVSVIQGATTYVVGVDFLVNGDYINWAPAGVEPATGSSYDVVLRYQKQLVPTTDFVRTGNDLDLSPAGDNPVNGTTMYVTYAHYLPRYDTVSIDYLGRIFITKGQPSIFPSAPPRVDGTLLLCTVYYPPNCAVGDVVINDSRLYRLTMIELADLRSRIEDLEYNAAVDDLDQEAFNIELPTAKKAIFTDVFRNFEKADVDHVLFDCAIDRIKTLSPPFTATYHGLAATGLVPPFAFLPYTEAAWIAQLFATDAININGYATFTSACRIDVSPAEDIGTETLVVVDDQSLPGWGLVEKAQQNWEFWVANDPGHFQFTGEALTFTVSGFSRAVTATIKGMAFPALADNLTLSMDNVVYGMTPVAPTVAGTNPNTVKSNANGEFTATVNFPAGVPGGAKSIVVQNVNSRGETQYVIGTRRRTVFITVVGDPLAETYVATDNTAVVALDLFFATKAAIEPVVVSIRNVVNGYPGQQVFAEAVVLPANVSISANGSVPTHVVFTSPAPQEAGREYAVVVATNSIDYNLYFARLGRRDLVSNAFVTVNPYTGVMFTSANASAWTADQTADLKFVLYRGLFTTTRVITFAPITVDGSVIYLSADQFTPPGTKVVWEWTADAGVTWVAIEPNTTVDTGVVMTTLQFRVTLYGTTTTSPVVFIPPGVLVIKWNATGKYVSRNVVLSAYTDIRVYMDINVPSGASVTMYYSINNGVNWVNMGAGTLQGVVGDGFSEYLWTATGLASPVNLRTRIDLTSNAGRTQAARARRLRAIAT